MSLSDPRVFFGVHSFAPYNRTNGVPYGIAKVLASSSLAISGELVNLNGGSNKWPWAVEDGLLNGEVSLSFREYPDFVFTLFLGKAPTNNAAEASGNVSTITNVKGSSAVDATTGMASIALKSSSEADLKFAKYIVEVITATTVRVYASTDLDFARGTDESFEDDSLSVVASDLTIPGTGGTVDLDDFGITITGGSGTVAMTVGDSAEFFVRPVNTKSSEVVIGATTDNRPEFGALIYGAQRGSGQMVEIEAYKMKAIGLPIGFTENAFSEAEVTAAMFYDSAKNAVFKMREVIAPAG